MSVDKPALFEAIERAKRWYLDDAAEGVEPPVAGPTEPQTTQRCSRKQQPDCSIR
ncbi:hypothetical protein JYT83_00820 [bacterium AH-315-F18]|nr:hypothetical protein [bacterium AH-315-F18]